MNTNSKHFENKIFYMDIENKINDVIDSNNDINTHKQNIDLTNSTNNNECNDNYILKQELRIKYLEKELNDNNDEIEYLNQVNMNLQNFIDDNKHQREELKTLKKEKKRLNNILEGKEFCQYSLIKLFDIKESLMVSLNAIEKEIFLKMNKNNLCRICLKSYEEENNNRFVLDPCGHSFCNICLRKTNSKCPMCREVYNKFIKLYN